MRVSKKVLEWMGGVQAYDHLTKKPIDDEAKAAVLMRCAPEKVRVAWRRRARTKNGTKAMPTAA